MVSKSILVILLSILIIGSRSERTIQFAKSNKEYYIISIQDVYLKKNIQEVNFYCLIDIRKDELKKLLDRTYNDRYSFYDSICANANAKGILDYWAKYWSNSCSKGRLNHLSNSSDSVLNISIINMLHDTLKYSFMHLNINDRIGQYIGIAKVDSLLYCNILEKSFCNLPSDTIVIFKKGFIMSKVKINN